MDRAGLGSVRQLTDANATVTLLQSYEPFGALLEQSGPAESGFGYTGEQVDGSGLVYLRARYYDPRLGRFLSKDPWTGSVLQSQSQNGWSYVRNNAINRVDPSGQIDWDACTIQGETGTCYFEPGDSFYKIAREIAAQTGQAASEADINALVGEMLGLNPRYQPNPNNVPVGGEVRLKADWIMMMRPGQPTPVSPPVSYSTPPYLPLILQEECPIPDPDPTEPKRIPIYIVGGRVQAPTEIIIFHPDHPPVLESFRQSGTAKFLSRLAATAGVTLDFIEFVSSTSSR